MPAYHSTISLKSNGDCDMIDVTAEVEKRLAESGIKTGTCTVFCAGSTAAVTTIEYEDGLLIDFPAAMERVAPSDAVYEHHLRWHDGNGHSHIRASVIGPSLTIPIVERHLCLGTWQQVVFVDFDNKPRSRKLDVMLMGE